jgi:DHA2 family multidrug resistance protein
MSATGQAHVVLRTAPAMAIVHLSTRYKAVAFGLMCLGCFLAYLDVQVVSASVQEIGGALSASQDELGWIQSSYLIAEIIVIPLSAWLSRVMSTRWLIATSAAGFTAASVLCSTAWDIDSMIAFRALQGLFGGSLIPTAFTAAVILFEGKHKAVPRPSSAPPLALRRRSDRSWAAGSRICCPGTGCSPSTSFLAR